MAFRYSILNKGIATDRAFGIAERGGAESPTKPSSRSERSKTNAKRRSHFNKLSPCERKQYPRLARVYVEHNASLPLALLGFVGDSAPPRQLFINYPSCGYNFI